MEKYDGELLCVLYKIQNQTDSVLRSPGFFLGQKGVTITNHASVRCEILRAMSVSKLPRVAHTGRSEKCQMALTSLPGHEIGLEKTVRSVFTPEGVITLDG